MPKNTVVLLPSHVRDRVGVDEQERTDGTAHLHRLEASPRLSQSASAHNSTPIPTQSSNFTWRKRAIQRERALARRRRNPHSAEQAGTKKQNQKHWGSSAQQVPNSNLDVKLRRGRGRASVRASKGDIARERRSERVAGSTDVQTTPGSKRYAKSHEPTVAVLSQSTRDERLTGMARLFYVWGILQTGRTTSCTVFRPVEACGEKAFGVDSKMMATFLFFHLCPPTNE